MSSLRDRLPHRRSTSLLATSPAFHPHEEDWALFLEADSPHLPRHHRRTIRADSTTNPESGAQRAGSSLTRRDSRRLLMRQTAMKVQ